MRFLSPLFSIAFLIIAVQCGPAALLQKRWAALSYGGEKYQFKQADEPMDPYAGTAYAGQDIPFRKDDPIYRQYYDQPNPYAVNPGNQQVFQTTATPINQYLMRDQPQQNGPYMYYPYRTPTNGITSRQQ
uniref:Uncharacterized protein n=1 Tax=Steinernema glaseri TaxID=37863 RepID=A0A1I7Y5Z2_9BILA